MGQEQDAVLKNIHQTRADLDAKIGQLEDQVLDTVNAAFHHATQSLNPVYQTKEHPWLMVGVATATGLFLGMRFGKRSEAVDPGSAPKTGDLFSRLASKFEEELQMTKVLGGRILLRTGGDLLKEAFPEYQSELREIVVSAESKLRPEI